MHFNTKIKQTILLFPLKSFSNNKIKKKPNNSKTNTKKKCMTSNN